MSTFAIPHSISLCNVHYLIAGLARLVESSRNDSLVETIRVILKSAYTAKEKYIEYQHARDVLLRRPDKLQTEQSSSLTLSRLLRNPSNRDHHLND